MRGGLSRGSTPLGYFGTGAGGRLMTEYASVVVQDDVPLESMKLMVRGHHDRQSRAFTDVIFEMRLEGKALAQQVKTLASQASEDCAVENTLAKAILVTTHVFLNGDKELTLARQPGDREERRRCACLFRVLISPEDARETLQSTNTIIKGMLSK